VLLSTKLSICAEEKFKNTKIILKFGYEKSVEELIDFTVIKLRQI